MENSNEELETNTVEQFIDKSRENLDKGDNPLISPQVEVDAKTEAQLNKPLKTQIETEEEIEGVEAEEELDLSPQNVNLFTEEQREQALQEVQAQFNFNGQNKYFFKDYKDKLAFRDKGDKLTTGHNDPRSAKAMAKLALSKGWESIKVNGHPDFKREVWLEAMSQGIAVRGYSPTEQDLKLLDSKLEKLHKNTIEEIANAEHEQDKTANLDTQSKANDDYDYDQAYDDDKEAKGKIVNFGVADYLFDPKNTKKPEDKSFFIELEKSNGDLKTVWGKDLERVIEDNKLKVNDSISLEKGLVINKGNKHEPRTQWIATVEKKEVIKAVSDAVIAKKISNPLHAKAIQQEMDKQLAERKNLPSVVVFDKGAAPRTNKAQTITVDIERAR